MRSARAICTLCGLGDLKPAPGTIGSAAAIPVAYLLHLIGGAWLLLPATVIAAWVGLRAVEVYLATSNSGDPSEVIIDEVVGQWIALWPLSIGLTLAGVPSTVFPYPGWIGAFVLFRLFDIWKPSVIGWADRKGGAIGVMLDDVFAGIAAALVISIAAMISHGVFG